MNEKRDIGVALLGYGLAGASFHAPVIAATPGLALRAVATSDATRAAAVRERYPGTVVAPTPEAAIREADDVDLVVIATPNRSHVALALDALGTGRHVVIDKPIAPDVAGAERIRRAAAAAGRLAIPFHNRRWDGDFLTVRRLLDSRRIGRVTRFESRFERWRPEIAPGWRESADPADAGGLLYDLGSHLIDQAVALFGPARRVYAEIDRRRMGTEVPDDVFVALTHAGGVRSHLWMSAVAGLPGPRFTVVGDQAAYRKWGRDPQEADLRAGAQPGGPGWGAEPESAWGVLGAGAETERVATIPGDYTAFYAGARDAILHDQAPPVLVDDAVEALRIIEAAMASATQGQVVEIPVSHDTPGVPNRSRPGSA